MRFTLQIPNDAPRHVLDVQGALAQIGIIDLAQSFGVIGGHLLKNELNIAQLFFKLAQHFID